MTVDFNLSAVRVSYTHGAWAIPSRNFLFFHLNLSFFIDAISQYCCRCGESRAIQSSFRSHCMEYQSNFIVFISIDGDFDALISAKMFGINSSIVGFCRGIRKFVACKLESVIEISLFICTVCAVITCALLLHFIHNVCCRQRCANDLRCQALCERFVSHHYRL